MPRLHPASLDAPTFNGQTRGIADHHLELGPGTPFSHYEIVSRLGAGGMGEVFKAWDSSLNRHVALKILPRGTLATKEMLRRFAREARAASALNHPNIITVYEIGHAEVDKARVDFLAMELIEGETLRTFLSRGVEMPKALHYLAQVADGLAKAHAAGLVHRDLKPENIMINADGFAKILDFGLARTAQPETEDSEAWEQIRSDTITRPGAVVGTIGYMSPEQVRGLPIDQRSDIFSFGCILYETLTHRRPFQGNSEVDTFHKIVYEPPPPIGEVTPPVSEFLRRVVSKCLGKDPEERYQSSKEIADWSLVHFRPHDRQYFRDLAIDPVETSHLYLVTSVGLMRSVSRGEQWSDYNPGLPTQHLNSVTVDPLGNVYAASSRGLFVNSKNDPLPAASRYSVSLRTYYGNLVSAERCGGSFLHANQSVSGRCETFEIFDLNGGQLNDGDPVVFRAPNGAYVIAEEGGNANGSSAPVNANRATAGPVGDVRHSAGGRTGADPFWRFDQSSLSEWRLCGP